MNDQQLLQEGARLLALGIDAPEQAATQEAGALRSVIEAHQKKYYLEDNPLVTDADFDALFGLLSAWEERFPQIQTDNSPTARAGVLPLSALSKGRHSQPMLSLGNAFSREEVADFLARVQRFLGGGGQVPEMFFEPKFDGLAISLLYEDGQLRRALTRGNGEVGEIVTENLRTLPSVPLRIDWPQTLEIRGEVMMLNADFEALNAQRKAAGEAIFATPRNAAAGSVRQLDSRITASRSLRFFAFEPLGNGLPQTRPQRAELLKRLGFLAPPLCKSAAGEIESSWKVIEQMRSQMPHLPFFCDGIVMKVSHLPTYQTLGATGHAPRGAIAVKLPAERVQTALLDVLWSVGRTGVVTPVAVLEPVVLGGVRVARATLHNVDELGRKQLQKGARVEVERAGEVIPRVVRAVSAGTEDIAVPRTCPECAGSLSRQEGEVALRCTNADCPAVLLGRLVYFCSKAGLDIRTLGPERLGMFFEHLGVRRGSDLFALTKERLMSLPLFQEKSAENVLQSLQTALSNAPPWRLLTALGVPMVGGRTARALLARIPSLRQLASTPPDALEHIRDVGPLVAAGVHAFFSLPENRQELEALLHNGFADCPEKEEAPQTRHPLSGKTVVLTGTIAGISRTLATEKLEALGMRVSGSISAKTDALIVGENPGSKAKKAEDLGVQIVPAASIFTDAMGIDAP